MNTPGNAEVTTKVLIGGRTPEKREGRRRSRNRENRFVRFPAKRRPARSGETVLGWNASGGRETRPF
jgi:hypothetical protein